MQEPDPDALLNEDKNFSTILVSLARARGQELALVYLQEGMSCYKKLLSAGDNEIIS